MLAEDSCLRYHNLRIDLCVSLFHEERVQFISYQGIAVPQLECRTCLARGGRRREHVVPNCLQGLQRASVISAARFFF